MLNLINKKNSQANKSVLFTLLIYCFLSGCGFYSFKGALPSHLQTVAVPLFDDRTSFPGVREQVTNGLVDQFIADNTLKVVDETKADVLISGAISSINQVAATVAAGETVSDYKVIVNVKVKAEDIKMSKVIFDKSFSQYGLMSSDGGQDEFDSAVEEAVQLITEDIVNATLSGW
jgi:hypothetical protein